MLDKQQMIAAAMELVEELAGDPRDAHEIQNRLHQLFNQMRNTGMPIPDDLARLENELSRDFRKPPDSIDKPDT